MSGRSGRSGSAEKTPLLLSRKVLLAVYQEARQAFPAECCGWLTGPAGSGEATEIRPCVNNQSRGQHPTAKERGEETAYVIDGADLLAFNRAFDSAQPPLAIYHSHPDSRAYFSAVDREVAKSPWGDGPAYPVQQLVVGLDTGRVTEAALFAWSDDAEDFVELARYPGADL